MKPLRVIMDSGHGPVLGTATPLTELYSKVKWDDGCESVVKNDQLVCHQDLKRAFKHGHKLFKRFK